MVSDEHPLKPICDPFLDLVRKHHSFDEILVPIYHSTRGHAASRGPKPYATAISRTQSITPPPCIYATKIDNKHASTSNKKSPQTMG
jgi:hypothetical protein